MSPLLSPPDRLLTGLFNQPRAELRPTRCYKFEYHTGFTLQRAPK